MGLTNLSFLSLWFLSNYLFQERGFKVNDGRKRRTGKSEARIVGTFPIELIALPFYPLPFSFHLH